MTAGRVVVVGSSNTDLTVRAPRLPTRGETVLGGDFRVTSGGKGANQAVAAARLGAQVTLVARLGRDGFGDRARAELEGEGISLRFLVLDSRQASGAALIVVDPGGDNLIAVASGANGALGPADVEAAAGAIAAADVVLVQLEVPLPAVSRTLELASAAGVRVILDPAPAPDLGLEPGLLRRTWLLTPNASEAARLTALPVAGVATAERAAARLHELGALRVCVTLGAAGCVLSTPAGRRHMAAPPAAAVDSTAAGDCFNGALGAALAAGVELEPAVEWAQRAAAVSVTRAGAQTSLPRRSELEPLPATGDLSSG